MRNKIHLVFTFTLLFILSCEKDDIENEIIEIETEIQQNDPNSSLSFLDYILPVISESVIQAQNSIVNHSYWNYDFRNDNVQYERADELQPNSKSTKFIKTRRENRKSPDDSKEKIELSFDFENLQTIKSNLDNQLFILTNQLNSLNLVNYLQIGKIIRLNVINH